MAIPIIDTTSVGCKSQPTFYFDRMQIWLSEPLSQAQSRSLARVLRHPTRKRFFPQRLYPMRYQPQWQQRIVLTQVDAPVLAKVARIIKQRHLVNYLEAARDECFDDAPTRDTTLSWRLNHEHRVYRRNEQDVVTVGNTTYDGNASAKTLARYDDDFCRMTGEANCLHSEIRVAGAAACRRIGIGSISDLLHFDHEGFWLKHTRIIDPSMERLGRLLRNRAEGTKSQRPLIEHWWNGRITVNVDYVYRAAECSVSKLMRKLGAKVVLRACGGTSKPVSATCDTMAI
jgi:hypothetical protein